MKLMRAFLIGIIAVTAYLLFLQWQFDYGGEQSRVKPELSNNTPVDQLSQPIDIAENAEQATQASDIVLTPKKQIGSSSLSATKSLSSLINIETDNLIVYLNPVGGDIVHLALKDHAEKLNSKTPLILLDNQSFTYIAQSGLIGIDGIDNQPQRPLYKTSKTNYSLEPGQEQLQVRLNYRSAKGLVINKTYTFHRASHLIKLDYTIKNTSSQSKRINLFGQIKHDGLEHYDNTHTFGVQPYLGGALTTEADNYQKITFSDIQKANLQKQNKGGWIALVQHYFVGAWVPSPEDSYVYQTRFAQNTQNAPANYILGFVGEEKIIAPHQEAHLSAEFYAGPKNHKVLKNISKHLELTVDYGWLWFISQPLFWLLDWIHSYIGNWGWSIVLLTLFIKLCFFHLSATSYRSMARMRQLGPKLTKLREQYSGDKQAFSKEMMAIYKKEKINPLSGCLPILVQMPVFIALYWTLLESVELRHSPFIFWIKDLSVMDPYFILPILMGISMFLQQQLSPTPIADPIQAKVMKSLPVIFTVFFLWFPSGLVLYWLVNNILSIAQQWFITRQIERKAKNSKA